MSEEQKAKLATFRDAMNVAYRQSEAEVVQALLDALVVAPEKAGDIDRLAAELVGAVRETRLKKSGIDAFLFQYDLSSEEGIALMCIAEAMLRIPDSKTIDDLIKDKVANVDWARHLGESESTFVNAATWGLMLTGRLLKKNPGNRLQTSLKSLVSGSSKPVIRKMVGQAMKILGEQFVMGYRIDKALTRARKLEDAGYRYSYDMLGEAACTNADAERYLKAYSDAIEAIGKANRDRPEIERAEVSVKLSALHPRYEFTQYDSALKVLSDRLLQLALQAKQVGIGLTVDAEESERLDLSLDIIEQVFCDPALADWEGLGLAVQAYQKRAPAVLNWLVALSQQEGKKIPVRLVKGAYWDSEIKHAQELGLSDYPVYTRKANTDVSYLRCAQIILENDVAIIARFATHNARTVATIITMAGDKPFEFQCLHGMSQGLYQEIVGKDKRNIPCRIYAPVGDHDSLLPYLVRRLLENGANTSFVNRIADEKLPISELIKSPLARVAEHQSARHPAIPLPLNLFAETGRKNSSGIDFSNHADLSHLQKAMTAASQQAPWRAEPLLGGEPKVSRALTVTAVPVYSPQAKQQVIGEAMLANEADLDVALEQAQQAFTAWEQTPVAERAACLERMADSLEHAQPRLMTLLVQEAGKTLDDAVNEVREAVDFCRYYAQQAIELLTSPVSMPGPTGEDNRLAFRGRGPIVCISPWNFPLAIFLGQISAALVTGNTVLAKPAEQTPLIAYEAVQLFYEAGIPRQVLQLLPGDGVTVGQALVNAPPIRGVMFTGSTETAHQINQQLAKRRGPIVPFIAETGGMNAMLLGSSALLEQALVDVLVSAFGSAGQRCSALRILFVQEDIADRFIELLKGGITLLKVGDPNQLMSDVGPVIDADAHRHLLAHTEHMAKVGKLIAKAPLPTQCRDGYYVAPQAYEIDDLSLLKEEVFGPILHVIRFKGKSLDAVVDSINGLGFGLTLGIQSRVDESVEELIKRLRIGNMYVNRNMIGAAVGVQPFGGQGLSGTGPKAGGPHYLQRLCTEQTVTINTAAAGGNATLMALGEEEH